MNKKEMFNLLNGESINVSEVTGTEIEVKAIIKVRDEEKNVIHFIDTENKHYASIATGVVSAYNLLKAYASLPTDNNTIKIMFVEREYDGGTFITFEVL